MGAKEFFKLLAGKLASTKLWLTVWAAVMATWIIVTRQDGLSTPLVILLAVPLSYMGLNVLQDFIFRGR